MKPIGRIIALFSLIFMSSCVNDLNTIKKVTFNSTDPDQRTENLHIFQTEAANAQFKLFAPLAESYSTPENITKFRKGIRVDFYTEDGEIETILTGLYGEINQSNGTMRVMDSVQLYNPTKQQTMYTEALYWNQKDSLIFTDKMVMIKSPTELLYGKGIKAKQDLSYYEFIEPQGKFLTK